MCEAVEQYVEKRARKAVNEAAKKAAIKASIETGIEYGASREQIISDVCKKYNMVPQKVEALYERYMCDIAY